MTFSSPPCGLHSPGIAAAPDETTTAPLRDAPANQGVAIEQAATRTPSGASSPLPLAARFAPRPARGEYCISRVHRHLPHTPPYHDQRARPSTIHEQVHPGLLSRAEAVFDTPGPRWWPTRVERPPELVCSTIWTCGPAAPCLVSGSSRAALPFVYAWARAETRGGEQGEGNALWWTCTWAQAEVRLNRVEHVSRDSQDEF